MPHVHIHILPRRKGDFEKNDEVYDSIDEAAKDMRRCCLHTSKLYIGRGSGESRVGGKGCCC